jgi:Tol biopolymer transport system component
VVFFRRIAGNNDVWLLDLARPVAERLTTDPKNDYAPVWSPDALRIAYCSAGDAVILSLEDGAHELLPLAAAPAETACPESWSRDGRFLLYSTGRSRVSRFFVRPMEPLGEAIVFAPSDSFDVDGAFSPDGKWIAYTSDESGQLEVFVGRFPGPLRKQRVSNSGGGMAVWRSDGRELFYIALDGKLMSVPFDIPRGGDSFVAPAPVPLFDARVGPGFQTNSGPQYGVAPDGQRFLLNRIVEQTAAPLTVVLDWQPGAAPARP